MQSFGRLNFHSSIEEFEYSIQEVRATLHLLEMEGTFDFPALKNGLFSAAIAQEQTAYTGYSHVWVRDNIYVSYCHYICGKTQVAIKNISTLFDYFETQEPRFRSAIAAGQAPQQSMDRPHIRFIGETLEESSQNWAHAQNDALGYFIWLACKFMREGYLKYTEDYLKILSLMVGYFSAIEYWQDEDSGHWEEDPKIEASSIGTVIAGLTELKSLILERYSSGDSFGDRFDLSAIDELIDRGKTALAGILPYECIQPNPQHRKYDSALLFLIFPLDILDVEQADKIIENVETYLKGDIGISRYLGDTFWCKDYKDIPEKIRTTISIERTQWLEDNARTVVPRQEAQWCIFDPILSCIYGRRFRNSRLGSDLERQIHYFKRSLLQVTTADSPAGGFKCPELYYLEGDRYVPNDATPLLWTQANLRIAFELMLLNRN